MDAAARQNPPAAPGGPGGPSAAGGAGSVRAPPPVDASTEQHHSGHQIDFSGVSGMLAKNSGVVQSGGSSRDEHPVSPSSSPAPSAPPAPTTSPNWVQEERIIVPPAVKAREPPVSTAANQMVLLEIDAAGGASSPSPDQRGHQHQPLENSDNKLFTQDKNAALRSERRGRRDVSAKATITASSSAKKTPRDGPHEAEPRPGRSNKTSTTSSDRTSANVVTSLVRTASTAKLGEAGGTASTAKLGEFGKKSLGKIQPASSNATHDLLNFVRREEAVDTASVRPTVNAVNRAEDEVWNELGMGGGRHAHVGRPAGDTASANAVNEVWDELGMGGGRHGHVGRPAGDTASANAAVNRAENEIWDELGMGGGANNAPSSSRGGGGGGHSDPQTNEFTRFIRHEEGAGASTSGAHGAGAAGTHAAGAAHHHPPLHQPPLHQREAQLPPPRHSPHELHNHLTSSIMPGTLRHIARDSEEGGDGIPLHCSLFADNKTPFFNEERDPVAQMAGSRCLNGEFRVLCQQVDRVEEERVKRSKMLPGRELDLRKATASFVDELGDSVDALDQTHLRRKSKNVFGC